METLRTFMGRERKAGELWAAPGPLGSLCVHFAIHILYKQIVQHCLPYLFCYLEFLLIHL